MIENLLYLIDSTNSYVLLGICLIYTIVTPILLGANFADYAADWYGQLKRPLFAAPDRVFPIVFPFFHLTEGISLWLILSGGGLTKAPLGVFSFFLATLLSALWSRVFFSWKRCDYALAIFAVEVPLNWIALWHFYGINSIASYLLLPISVWSSYAIFINYGFLILNLSEWEKLSQQKDTEASTSTLEQPLNLILDTVRIFSADLHRSGSFYRDVLGFLLEFDTSADGYLLFQSGDVTVVVEKSDPLDESTGELLIGRCTGLSFKVTDIWATYDRLVKAGVEFLSPPEQQTWGGCTASFKDIDHNVLTIVQFTN